MLVDKQEYDSVVDIIEPSEVNNVQMGWVCTIGDDTISVVGLTISTPKNDEKTTRIMVPMDVEMNCM